MTEYSLTCKTQIILIGGTSHTGKSTLGRSLASRLNGACVSTDSLARHPGRPWKENPELIPAHVREHYSTLSVEKLIAEVLHHYQCMWPKVESIILSHLDETQPLIIEGSALLPELVDKLKVNDIFAVWLTASEGCLRKRIYLSSRYEQQKAEEKKLIDTFLARTVHYNYEMMKRIKKLKLRSVNVEEFESSEALTNKCLESIPNRK